MLFDNMYILESMDIFTEEDKTDEEKLTDVYPESIPLIKYELLQKLVIMRNKLKNRDVYDTDLDTLIQFGENLNYNTLLLISNELINKIREDLKAAAKVAEAEEEKEEAEEAEEEAANKKSKAKKDIDSNEEAKE